MLKPPFLFLYAQLYLPRGTKKIQSKISAHTLPFGPERLTDFIFMKPSYDSSPDEVDEPEETRVQRIHSSTRIYEYKMGKDE